MLSITCNSAPPPGRGASAFNFPLPSGREPRIARGPAARWVKRLLIAPALALSLALGAPGPALAAQGVSPAPAALCRDDLGRSLNQGLERARREVSQAREASRARVFWMEWVGLVSRWNSVLLDAKRLSACSEELRQITHAQPFAEWIGAQGARCARGPSPQELRELAQRPDLEISASGPIATWLTDNARLICPAAKLPL